MMQAQMRILVADDDADVRRLVRRVLTSEVGAEVREAPDGLTALEALEAGDIDLAILDIKMGVIEGPDALEAIRKSEAFATLPVIMISGQPDESSIRRIQGLHVDGFIAKPFSLPLLRDRLIPLIRQLVPPRTTGAAASKLVLQASSRVLVVGPESAYKGVVLTHVGPLCVVKAHAHAPAALRETLATRPDLVFVTGADLVLPPGVFARAVRRDAAVSTRLVHCGPALAAGEAEPFDVQWTGPATFDGLLAALGPRLAGATVARLVLGPASPAVAAALEQTRAAVAAVYPAARVVREAPLALAWPAGTVVSQVRLYADDQAWRLTLLAARPFAAEYAGRQGARDSDVVTVDAATTSLHRLASTVAAGLVQALQGRGLTASLGEPGTRTGGGWDGRGRTKPDAVEWWVATDGDQVGLAGQLAPHA